MALVLGIDIGTTGTRTIVFDTDRQALLGAATAEYPLHTPRPGWTEQDPLDWWRATVETIGRAVNAAGVAATDIAAVGLSGQMHGSVFLNQAGEVIRPALLWNDQRTGRQCDYITEHAGETLLHQAICNPILTGFQAPKIIWLRDEEPDHYHELRHVLLPKDYIRYRLTGTFATEVSDAAGTALLDVPARDWSIALLERIEIPPEWLPPVHESPTVSAEISGLGAAATGLAQGTKVVGGAGDNAAGAVGTGVVRPGLLWVSTGTSGVVFVSSDTPNADPDLRIHTFCHAVPGKWHQMGVMLSAGGSLRWYRDTLAEAEVAAARQAGRDPYDLIGEQAAQAPVGSEGLIFLPYLTGERTPHADPDARGAFVNLSLRHDKRHLARAVLEGVAFGLRDSLEIMRASGVPIDQVRASGGGARSAVWRQIQADVFGLPITTINVEEGPALGVALLAAVGAGVYDSVEAACDATIATATTTEPVTAHTARYNELYEQLYTGLYGSLRDEFSRAAALVERHASS